MEECPVLWDTGKVNFCYLKVLSKMRQLLKEKVPSKCTSILHKKK